MKTTRRTALRLAAVLGVLAFGLGALAGPASASGYVTINGSGSSWAAVAIDQWISDVQDNGFSINFSPDGSAAGRVDYMENQDAFAASDPPFNSASDELAPDPAPQHPTQGYSYIPDVAGGTAFMYHIEVGGHLLTNLRLTGETLTKIFTGVITNWDNPEITKDAGQQLPNLPITPVVRADGSGATYFFTNYMALQYPSLWNAFCTRVKPSITLPCPKTEFYPTFGDAKAENGSTAVSAYITSSYGNGSIGYDEYAYAQEAHFPVVAIANAGGYWVQPNANSVSIALLKAQINNDPSSDDYLQQTLNDVYTDTDPRAYPLSSYSYFIVPKENTTLPTNFSTADGYTLSSWLKYDLCVGQQQVDSEGYAALPLGLVKGAFTQVGRIPGHIAVSDSNSFLAGCDNPTFKNGVDTLITDVPNPPGCDRVGQPLDACGSKGAGSAGDSQDSGHGGSGTSGGSGTTPSGNSTTGAAPGSNTSANQTGAGGSETGTDPSSVTGQAVTLAGDPQNQVPLAGLTAAAILAAVAAPPLLAYYLRRRRRRQFRG